MMHLSLVFDLSGANLLEKTQDAIDTAAVIHPTRTLYPVLPYRSAIALGSSVETSSFKNSASLLCEYGYSQAGSFFPRLKVRGLACGLEARKPTSPPNAAFPADFRAMNYFAIE